MKKIFFSITLLLIFASLSYSQKTNIRLNAYGAYVFDDEVDNGYSSSTQGYFNGTIKGGFMWGVGLEFRLQDYYGLELLYQRLDTHAPIDHYDYNSPGVKKTTLDVSVNYIMLGGARSLRANAKTEPYGGFMLGMGIVDTKNPETGSSSSATKFAWGLRGGVNVWASERVGIKLQAQLLSIPQGAGGGVYFGTGGAGVGVSTYSSMLQFVLGGGLTFKLGGQGQHAQTQTAQ